MDAHDEHLLKRIQKRDELALSDFMDRNHEWVFGYAMGYLKNFQDAEEATMDIFQHIWAKPKQWNPEKGTFNSFFGTIVRSRVTDVYRKKVSHAEKIQKQTAVMTDDYLLDRVARQDEDMAFNLEREELHDAIVRALETVEEPKHRLAWVLRHFEGYSQKDVARIMDASVGSIKIWIFRCKEVMRKSLEKENFHEVAGLF